MGVLGVLNQATLGDAISSSEYNENMNNIRDSVNNVVADQITDNTITSAKIKAGTIIDSDISNSAEVSMSKITSTPSDATLQAVLSNFIDGCFIYRVDGDNIGITVGSIMINGELRRNTSAIENLTFSAPDDSDWLDVYAVADAVASTFTGEIVDSGATPGGSTPSGTNTRLIGSIKYINGTAKIASSIQYREDKVVIWDYVPGNGTATISKTIKFGVTFDYIAPPLVCELGTLNGSVPTTPGDFSGGQANGVSIQSRNTTTSQTDIYMQKDSGNTFASGLNSGISIIIPGRFS